MRQFLVIISFFLYLNSFGQHYSQSWKDLNYAGDSMNFHTLDIYLPNIENPVYPAVIAVYGSAWFSSNLKGSVMGNLAKPLLDAGYAVIAPNRRSSRDARFPAQVNDIKAVVRFVKANAGKYRLDSSFVAITGFLLMVGFLNEIKNKQF